MKKCISLSLFLFIGTINTWTAKAENRNDAGEGAYYTGIYRNLFKEILGKSDCEINAKVNNAFQQLFYGNDNQRLYYETGNDMAYIKDIANNDIRTEGMSYGMMICVQLDKKAEFDKLWKWAKTYMQYPESNSFSGYFAWQCQETGEKIGGDTTSPAPDGEAYFITALFFASHRWGDSTGIYNYKAEAQYILKKILSKEGTGDAYNMFDQETSLITFVPDHEGRTYTDPSYQLPAFFELWARWSDSNSDFWLTTPPAARTLLQHASHKITGLFSDYSHFDGTPYKAWFNTNSDRFQFDAWRCAMNIGMDYHWFRKDSMGQQTIMTRLLTFFRSQGDNYLAHYNWDGSDAAGDHSPGLIASNAVGCFAVDDENLITPFLLELWTLPVPTGFYRYFDGMLYMLSLLHVTGNFRVWNELIYPVRCRTQL